MGDIWEALLAVKEGNIPSLTEQLNSGLNLDRSFRAETLLCTAIKENQYLVVQFFLENGANPNKKSEENGRNEPPLITATRLGKLRILELLLMHGARITDENFYGQDAVYQSVQDNSFGVLEILMNHLMAGSPTHRERNCCPLIHSIKLANSHPRKKPCLFILLKNYYLCNCLRDCFAGKLLIELRPNEFRTNNIEPDPQVLTSIYLATGIRIQYNRVQYNQSEAALLPLKLNLMNIARIEIRNCVARTTAENNSNFTRNIDKLSLPRTLIDFLLMS